MNILTISKEPPNPTIEWDSKELFNSGDELVVASFLASLSYEKRWLHIVTDWYTGENGDLPEDYWDFEGSTRADEWLEDWISGADGPTYQVGSEVHLPCTLKYRKTQKLFCVVDSINPERGLEYAVLRGITKRGVSKSDSQLVYWPLKNLHKLQHNGIRPNYKPITIHPPGHRLTIIFNRNY